MLKIIGILGLMLSFGLYGISRSNNLKLRIKLLEDFYEMIIELKGQINYFKEPLPNIFKKVGKNSNSKAFLFLNGLGDEIDKKGSYTSNFWSNKVKSTYKDDLIPEDIEIMSYLGDFLGQTDYENHLQHFLYIENKLKNQIEKAKNTYEQKSPLYNKIGFFIGAIIGILLI